MTVKQLQNKNSVRALVEECVCVVLLAWHRVYRIASSSRARHASDLTAASQNDRASAQRASSATHQVGLFTSRHVTCSNCVAAFIVRHTGPRARQCNLVNSEGLHANGLVLQVQNALGTERSGPHGCNMKPHDAYRNGDGEHLTVYNTHKQQLTTRSNRAQGRRAADH